MLIIPLMLQQSRGDLILNAKSFAERGYALMLEEEQLTKESLLDHLKIVMSQSERFKNNMKNSQKADAIDVLVKEIRAVVNGSTT